MIQLDWRLKKLELLSGKIEIRIVWLKGTPWHCSQISNKLFGIESLIANENELFWEIIEGLSGWQLE